MGQRDELSVLPQHSGFRSRGFDLRYAISGQSGFSEGNAAYPLLWNLIGSHDTARILHLCGEDKCRQKLAAELQLLNPGMPMIYYGDEVGMTGGIDPDCRRGMLWNESRQDRDMLNWYRKLLRLRKEFPAITEGCTVLQEAVDEAGFIRITRKRGDQELTLLFCAKHARVKLPALTGKTDFLNGSVFGGEMRGIGAMVLA